jgi:hypothetical protein
MWSGSWCICFFEGSVVVKKALEGPSVLERRQCWRLGEEQEEMGLREVFKMEGECVEITPRSEVDFPLISSEVGLSIDLNGYRGRLGPSSACRESLHGTTGGGVLSAFI